MFELLVLAAYSEQSTTVVQYCNQYCIMDSPKKIRFIEYAYLGGHRQIIRRLTQSHVNSGYTHDLSSTAAGVVTLRATHCYDSATTVPYVPLVREIRAADRPRCSWESFSGGCEEKDLGLTWSQVVATSSCDDAASRISQRINQQYSTAAMVSK